MSEELFEIKRECYSLPKLYEWVYYLLQTNIGFIDDYCVGAYNFYTDFDRLGAVAELGKASGGAIRIGFSARERGYYLHCATERIASLIEVSSGGFWVDTDSYALRNESRFGIKERLVVAAEGCKHFAEQVCLSSAELSARFELAFGGTFKPIGFTNAGKGGVFLMGFHFPLPFVFEEVVRYRLNGDWIDYMGVDKKGRLCVFAVSRGEHELDTIARARVGAVFIKLLLESEFGHIIRRLVAFNNFSEVVGLAVFGEVEYFEPTEKVHGVSSGVVSCGNKIVVY